MRTFKQKLTFIIPARMESTRFPNKPLKLLNKKPVIDWVYNNCLQSNYSKKVLIATDSSKIVAYCKKTKKSYIYTGEHNCASNRVAEASEKINSDWIVEVQGDEPLLWAQIMDDWLLRCIRKFDRSKPDLFISIAELSSKEADDPNFVKIIKDISGRLQWVSRSRIPCNLKRAYNGKYYRHTGFHLWNKASLVNFAKIEPSQIEKTEDTHATRIVENNFFAQTVELPDTQAIDNPKDLTKAQSIINKLPKT